MDLAAYIYAAVRQRIPWITVSAVRFDNAADAAGPSVMWRMAGKSDAGLLDRGTAGILIEIHSRSPVARGARFIISEIVAQFERDKVLNQVIEEADEPADASSLRAGHFAFSTTVEIQPGGLPAPR